jgi:3-phosphoshikimate 1-carboxyvinyltransferase
MTRMAMAFAPLALKVPIIIENAEVVSKSYPGKI